MQRNFECDSVWCFSFNNYNPNDVYRRIVYITTPFLKMIFRDVITNRVIR